MENENPEIQSPDQRDEPPATRKGFDYHVSQEQIDEYRTWPYARRLEWLLAGNRLRQALPLRIKEIQDKFRRGEI
jgi:hypothetical protein